MSKGCVWRAVEGYVEGCRGDVEHDSLTAAVEAVELSRICRELLRIAVELSSRGSDRCIAMYRLCIGCI